MENVIVFCVKGTNIYLAMNLYGDEFSRGISIILAHKAISVGQHTYDWGYTVDKESQNGNCEEQGLNYFPMTAELGPPGLLQVFKLE